MTNFDRGDVVLVDLGATAKVRPCVVISISGANSQRNMSNVVPMTTEIRGGECEVEFEKPVWIRSACVVNVLGVAGVDNAKILRRLGGFPEAKLAKIYAKLSRAFGLK
jgi:mRNA interferase MazF